MNVITIIGLGNPGKQFEKTWHNVGFWVIDEFFKKNKEAYNFSNFVFNKKTQSLMAKGFLNDKKIILAKPQTFMNNSGKAVKQIVSNFQISIPNSLLVIHDDVDIPLGDIKIVKNRGAAGHKGVNSIIQELKSKNFIRIRIGANCFAQNKKSDKKNQKLDKFVLKKIAKNEEKVVKEAIEKTIEAIEFSLKNGADKAMNVFN